MSATSFSLLYFLRCQQVYAIVFEKKIPKKEEKRDTPEGKKAYARPEWNQSGKMHRSISNQSLSSGEMNMQIHSPE